MKLTISAVALAAALVAGASAANAGTQNLGDVDPNTETTVGFTNVKFSSALTENYDFSLVNESTVTSATVTVAVTAKNQFSGTLFLLEGGNPLETIATGSFTFIANTSNATGPGNWVATVGTDNSLMAGDYVVELEATAPHGKVTASGNLAVTGVPETSTWAMLGLGFGGLAFAGFRSRRTAISALA